MSHKSLVQGLEAGVFFFILLSWLFVCCVCFFFKQRGATDKKKQMYQKFTSEVQFPKWQERATQIALQKPALEICWDSDFCNR